MEITHIYSIEWRRGKAFEESWNVCNSEGDPEQEAEDILSEITRRDPIYDDQPYTIEKEIVDTGIDIHFDFTFIFPEIENCVDVTIVTKKEEK